MNLVSQLAARWGTPPLAAVVLSLAWAARVTAADASLGLDEVIERVRADAPQIVEAQARLEGAQSAAPSAGRLPDPEAIVGVDNLPINTADQFSLTRDFMTMRKAGLMQSVPNGAKRHSRSELAAREIDVAEAQLKASRFETARAAADAWIASAAAEQSLARLRALRGDLSLQSSAARAALASGRSSAGDALASESALARLDNRILELEQELAMRRAELGRWVGAESHRTLGALPWRRELGGTPQALAQDIEMHPPLAPLAAGIDAARAEVALARAEKRPDWSAELSYAKRGPDFSDMVSLEFRIGLPLFAKNRQNPMIAEKLATVRAEEAARDAGIRMHRAEIEAALATRKSGRARLEHFDKNLLPLARDRSRTVLSSYGSGRGDLRSVLDALSDEIDAQLDYVALEADVTRAWVFLHLLHSGASS